MANCKFLISVLLLAWSGAASAGYAQAVAPSNFTGVPGGWMYKAAVNDVSFTGGVRGSAGVLNVAGRSVVMPAAYRFAANAPLVAARFMWANPLLMAGLVVGSALYDYYKSAGYVVEVDSSGNATWRELDQQGCAIVTGCPQWRTPVDTYHFMYNTAGGYIYGVGRSMQASCGAAYAVAPAFMTAYGAPNVVSSTCKFGTVSVGTVSTWTPAPYVPPSTRPVTQAAFEQRMPLYPLPYDVPQKIPTPLPVEIPIINPTPEPVPRPAVRPVPTPQPMRVPQGEPQAVPLPVPNPENLPQTWKSPVIDVVPSPTANEPWRVDVQPKDIVSTSPSPLPESSPVPVTPPEGEEVVPEEKPGLCDQYPDILACQKLDTPEGEEMETVDKPISVSPDSGWGSGNASCPVARHITVQGRDVPIPFDLFCQYMSGIRPIIIAMAWLSAGFILLGIKGGD